MKNIGITNILYDNEGKLLTKKAILIRKNPLLYKPLKFIEEKATRGKIIVESYPELNKNENYIFASTHYFSEDIISAFSKTDRNAWALIGCTDQIRMNPEMYIAWINGIIYVDRKDEKSRKSSINKMIKILNNGTSILIYPEGGWNNTENLLVQELFNGPYILSKATNCKVVPISQYFKDETDEIYMRFGEPIELYKFEDKEEAKTYLRDVLATMMYEMYLEHAERLERSKCKGNLHLEFMKCRKEEYKKQRWSGPEWICDDEITRYSNKKKPRPDEIRDTFRNLNIDSSNAAFFAPLLREIADDDMYNLKEYIRDTFYQDENSKGKIKKKKYQNKE